jgi:hypothetical protein
MTSEFWTRFDEVTRLLQMKKRLSFYPPVEMEK